jgi:hypothetical protein
MSREPYLVRTVEQRDAIRDLVGKLDVSKPWSITVEPWKKKRTLSQNALYFKWVSIVANETGNSQDDVHEAFKQKFCPPRVVKIGDDERSIYTTTKLTTQEMTDYINKVYAYVTSELGYLLPLPEEMHNAA